MTEDSAFPVTKSGEAMFGSASARSGRRSSGFYERIRQSGYLFGPGTHPGEPIENPSSQIMKWACIRCDFDDGTFEGYMAHRCAKQAAATGGKSS